MGRERGWKRNCRQKRQIDTRTKERTTHTNTKARKKKKSENLLYVDEATHFELAFVFWLHDRENDVIADE